MATMKYPNVTGAVPNIAVAGSNVAHLNHHHLNHLNHHLRDQLNNDVDSIFATSCWPNTTTNGLSLQNEFIDVHGISIDNNLGVQKLFVGDGGDTSPHLVDDQSADALDRLFLSDTSPTNSNQGSCTEQSGELAELKTLPSLPPFTGYTANLSINGIQGHHYHTISQQNSTDGATGIGNNDNDTNVSVTAATTPPTPSSFYGGDQNIVSSSTTIPNSESPLTNHNNHHHHHHHQNQQLHQQQQAKIYGEVKLAYANCANETGDAPIKTGIGVMEDISLDLANIIGSAIADTTVEVALDNQKNNEDQCVSRDSWPDFEFMCGDKNLIITSQDTLGEFVFQTSPPQPTQQQQQQQQQQQHQQSHQQKTSSSTLQSLLTHGYVPLMQNRLQNGPQQSVKAVSPTSSGYEMITTTTSPPANVGSTTDNLMLTVNGRFLTPYGMCNDTDAVQQHQQQSMLHQNQQLPQLCHQQQQQQQQQQQAQTHRMHSPDTLNYPHITTTNVTVKKSRSRSQSKKQQQAHQQQQLQQHQASSSTHSGVFQTEPNNTSKDKPVHRCSICNRGFLNKSNIKVHLRTHTGEKPFRCDTCSKAFRQKAHLLKHQQIHKRTGRD